MKKGWYRHLKLNHYLNSQNNHIRAYQTLFFVSFLYGGNIICARLISGQMPFFVLSTMRGILGLAVLLPFAWQQMAANAKLNRQDLFYFILLGFIGITLPYTTLVWGMQQSTAANASIILATGPAITLLLLALGWKAKPSLRQCAGIALSFGGLLLVFSKGSLSYLLTFKISSSDIILLINVVSASLFNIVGQDVMKKHPPLVTATYSLIFGTIMLIPFAAWEWNNSILALPLYDWAIVFYMGAIVTGAALLFNLKSINVVGSGKAAIFINLMPIFGILLGVLLLGEKLVLYHWVGIVLVFAGIVLSLSRSLGVLRYDMLKELMQSWKIKQPFAEGLNLYKLFWIFVVFSILGFAFEKATDFIEFGAFQKRQGLLYGPLSQVYGMGAVFIILLAQKIKKLSNFSFFVFCSFLGAVYEYICSLLEEYFFGFVSWQYNGVPLNINGRTNLVYSMVWGLLGLIIARYIYPRISKFIEKVPVTMGKIITWLLVIAISLDIFISAAAVKRFSERHNNISPANSFEVFLDNTYPDSFMQQRLPTLRYVENP